MDEELTSLIVEELGKRHDRKQIIRRVRERTGLNWKEAQQLLVFVEAQNRKAIAARQSPLLFLLSIGVLLLGFGLLAFNLQTLLALSQPDLLGVSLSLQWSSPRMIELFASLGITAGGMVGLWKGLFFIFPD